MFSGATRDKTDSFWAVILLAQLAPQFWSNTCAFNGRQKWINHPLLKAAKLATCSIVAVEQRQRTSCQSLRSRRALNGFDSLLVVRSLFAATWKWRTVKIARGENDRYEIAGHENAGLIMLDKKHGSSWHETIAFLLWSYPTWTPAGMGKGGGGTCRPLEMLWSVFVHWQWQQNAQQTNYLCIIFTACRRLLGASPPDLLRISIPGPRWGTFVPDPKFAHP